MDFALLPPEVNSGRMYAGPGSGPLLAAAAAWDGLAGELQSTTTSYASVISELTAGPWLGAASAAMTSAVAPFVAWMRATAAQAEQTAAQAKAAAAAYEAAFAAMVPPPVIAGNRALLQALVATNLFGQNTPAISFTECHYAQMWAQDATAMYGYAGASASARTLPPFSLAPQTTTPGASPAASALRVAAQAAAATAGPAAASDFETNVLFLPSLAQAGLTPLNTASLFVDLQYDDEEVHFEGLESTDREIVDRLEYNGFHLPPNTLPASTPAALGQAEARAVTAGLGQAPTVGRLSVPPAWAVAAPEVRLAALASPSAGVGAVPEVMAAGSPGSLFSEMALANMAGRAVTPTPGGRQGRVGCPGVVSAMPTSASGHGAAIAAQVHEFADALLKLGDLRDSGLLTEEEFTKEKERLLAR